MFENITIGETEVEVYKAKKETYDNNMTYNLKFGTTHGGEYSIWLAENDLNELIKAIKRTIAKDSQPFKVDL